jgi:bifunctional oligoribonuclease and PAP phosphatase NrnA
METAYVPQELLDFITENKRFLLVGHKEPDGDCIGSQLALASALHRMGKEAQVYSAGPFKRPEIKDFETSFKSTISAAEKKDACIIVLDCSALSRTGDLEDSLAKCPLAFIDHHASSDASGDIRFIDAKAPSVTFMVLHILEALGHQLNSEEAKLLFLGLMTDTGFFRHLDNTTSRVFSAAARLVAAGANPKHCFHAINGGKSLESRKLLGILLQRAELYCNGKLLISWEEEAETAQFGMEGRDSDALYQLLISVQGVEAVVVIRQESAETCTVGFRSLDTVDVAVIAASFGGGGHKQAAGLAIDTKIATLKPKIIQAFTTVLGN